MHSVCFWWKWIGGKSMAMDETNLAMGQTRLAMDKGTLLENFFENFFLKGNYEFKIFFSKIFPESLAMDKTAIRFWRRQTCLAMDKINVYHFSEIKSYKLK